MIRLSEKEKEIIRYYEGDVSGTDPFWSDPKAYLTINSLFFPGIENEVARTDESKKLNPHFFDDDERTVDVCQTLFESGLKLSEDREIKVFRVERYRDYLQMKDRGSTVSFTSTSTAGFLKSYSDKRGIALLNITIEPNVPCINMAAVLDYYAKKEEQEILLLPGSIVEIKEKPVEEQYMDILDMDGNPPKVMADIKVKGISYPDLKEDSYSFDRESLYRVYDRLNSHQRPDESDVEDYLVYKKYILKKIYDILK